MFNILSIAGSDSSGGAGISQDIRTILACGQHPLSVVTAVTAQNSVAVSDIFPVDNVRQQLDTLKTDMLISAIKIGMLYSKETIKTVTDFVKNMGVPIVTDPVMIATTGRWLIEDDAVVMMIDLLKASTLITPNRQEAEFLSGISISTFDDAKSAALALNKKFETNVLIKSGHLPRKSSDGTAVCTDLLCTGQEVLEFTSPYINYAHTHGTGCCLSSAIACFLGQKYNMHDSVSFGKMVINIALNGGYQVGKGEGNVDPLIHFITNAVSINDVANSCLACGGRPVMAESPDEMQAIARQRDGLVINLGLLNEIKAKAMTLALFHTDPNKQKVLLDPVGCATFNTRLRLGVQLLGTRKIDVLKMNPTEALSLRNHYTNQSSQPHEKIGIDSYEMSISDKQNLALELLELIPSKDGFTIVITGKDDVIADKNNNTAITGGSNLQQSITGTGCMLSSVIMNHLVKSEDNYSGCIHAIKKMNIASQKAHREVNGQRLLSTYRQKLIDYLSEPEKSIYLITDEKLDFYDELIPKTIDALDCGIHILQYRAKNKDHSTMISEAKLLRKLTKAYGVTFIINDYIWLAKEVDADGIHLGQEDEAIIKARLSLGPDKIIGATAKTVMQGNLAKKSGATYLGVGALYPSPTKKDAIKITFQDLEEIRGAVDLPIYGIGGINADNLEKNICTHIDGIAVVSAHYEKNQLTKIKQILN